MSQFKGNSGTLIIVVSRAKDLPNKRKMEKQSPYCLLRISNLMDKTKACVRGGQNPRWDEEFRFSMTPDIQPVLKLSVLDETKKAPVFISETEIDFTPVFYSSVKEGYDNWYSLTSNNREAGQVYLEMTFYPTTNGFSSSTGSTSSNGSKKTMKLSQSPTKRRNLPPIPGQELVYVKQEEANSIPPPIPRGGVPVPSHKLSVDHIQSRSIHGLPDVPMHHSVIGGLHDLELEHPLHQKQYIPKPPSKPKSHQPSQFHSVADDSNDNFFTNSLPPPSPKKPSNSSSNDLISLTKKFASSMSIFGSKETSSPSLSSPSKQANPFDELEREVQSDWEKNNPSRPISRSSSPSKKKPPPVPSHGSFQTSGSSMASLPPLPQHSVDNNSIANYDIIEPGHYSANSSGGLARKAPSPTGKKPTDIDPSQRIMDLNSIPSSQW